MKWKNKVETVGHGMQDYQEYYEVEIGNGYSIKITHSQIDEELDKRMRKNRPTIDEYNNKKQNLIDNFENAIQDIRNVFIDKI